jgi:hypothetical protein
VQPLLEGRAKRLSARECSSRPPILSLRRTDLPSDTEKAGYHWVVHNGSGDRIGKTNHPAIWATRHPKLYRKYRIIRFDRRHN